MYAQAVVDAVAERDVTQVRALQPVPVGVVGHGLLAVRCGKQHQDMEVAGRTALPPNVPFMSRLLRGERRRES